MRDREIRAALRQEIEAIYSNEGDTLVIDELGVCEGDARVDIAVVNGALTGYEIKSEADTLQRLPHQAKVYSRLLDQVTIVSSGRHLEKAKLIVPEWWGLSEVVERQGRIEFSGVREPQDNPSVDPFALAQLLWRDEALNLLIELGVQKGMRSKSRPAIWKRLCDSTSLPELSALVRQQLKARRSWKSVRPQASNGDSSQRSATLLDSRVSLCAQHTS
jgi:hypothetical protein